MMPPTRRGFIAGSAAFGGLAAGGSRVTATPPPIADSPRERLSFDEGWRFHEGDIPFPPILDHEAAYANGKAGNAAGAAASDYDDSGWPVVAIPHDWALGQPFDRAANIDQGFRRRGIGWYRRTFALDAGDRDRHLELQFGAIATHATIWINGTLAHRSFSGFTGFSIDLGAFALFGDDLNTIAIRVDADATESWWYEGAGLYRHAWLIKRPSTHIATDGIHADPRGQGGAWHVPVAVTVVNSALSSATVTIEAILTDPTGRAVARSQTDVVIAADAVAVARLSLPVADPQLWSPDTPALYQLETRLLRAGQIEDAVDTALGFRTIRFDAAKGFFLNGKPLKIKGVCAHQDHAGVGVAVPDSLWDYRLRRLKAMGANALRCAHNAPASELLDAADRIGIMVMDEHRELSAAEDTLERLAWLVRRDRNHPSIILWSLCNEESLQSSALGVAMFRRMKSVVRALDPARPITAALNGAMFASPNIADELDVVGFNYGTAQYDRYHSTYPGRPLLSSEDTSAYMTRGALRTDRTAYMLADDDSEHAGWGLSHRAAWRSIAGRPFMAGGFVWTGFDYRGEPTPFEWPSVGASFGAMDLCGFAKSAFHIRRALWTDPPMLELSPHWTWPGHEGQPITLTAITNADRVVLRLNGRIVADVPNDRFAMASITLPYTPGRLEGIAYRGKRAVAHRRIDTAGPAVALRLTSDRSTLAGDRRDTVPVTVDAVDARGRAVPGAGTAIRFQVEGGTILGVGNGDPNSHESDLPGDGGRTATRRLFSGLAQVLVQAGDVARLQLTAEADGLRPASAVLAVTAPRQNTVAPQDGRQILTEWRQAPPSASPPDLRHRIGEGDMNSWGWLKPGSTEIGTPDGRYVLFYVSFTPRRLVAANGGRIVFAALAGPAQIWVDGTLVHTKSSHGTERCVTPLSAGPGDHVVQIVFDTHGSSARFGLAGTVTVAT
ncbi:beta-galactosidase [Sphingomonadaceae bacterium OTU29THOMA1]|nr:beta-galactosidase [Sphingomonadaceae bacterium OTU29THOMA1]